MSFAMVVMAKSSYAAGGQAINPINAVIATVIVIIAGVFIYIKRHRDI